MAHLIQTGPVRSELVAQALKRVRPVPQQVQSVGEGFTRLGSQLVDTFSQTRQIDKRTEEQLERQTERSTALANALRASETPATTPEGQEITNRNRLVARSLIGSDIPDLQEQGINLLVGINRSEREARELQEATRIKAAADIKKRKVRPATNEEKEARNIPIEAAAQIDADGKISILPTQGPDAPIKALNNKGELVFATREQALSGELTPVPSAGQTISVTTPDGQTLTITSGVTGPSNLGRRATGRIEEDLINGEGTLQRLQSIMQEFDPDALTFFGKAEASALRFAEKAGVDLSAANKLALAQRRRFTNAVEQNFNLYRKNITGAAAAIKELEILRESFLSSDLSPTEFKAEFDRYQGQIKRSQRLLRRIRREGLDKPFGTRMDELFTTGQDDDPQARGQELLVAFQARGLTGQALQDAISDQLIAEDYNLDLGGP